MSEESGNLGMAVPPSWIERLFRAFLGLVFGLAAISKIVGFREFGVTVRWLIPFQWLTINGIVALAVLVIAIEVYLAVWLLTTGTQSRHLIMVGALIVVFTLAPVRIWQSPLAPDCNCLSLLKIARGANSSAGDAIVCNVALLVIVGWLVWQERHRGRLIAETARGDVVNLPDDLSGGGA